MKRYALALPALALPALALIVIFTLSSAAETPRNGPLPAARPPDTQTDAQTAPEPAPAPDPPAEEIPVPVQEEPQQPETVPDDPPAPAAKPVPPQAEKPEDNGTDKDGSDDKAVDDKAEAPQAPLPEDKTAHALCLTALEAAGAKFRPLERITGEENGCGIEAPLEITATGAGIKLEPAATMRCEAALALSRWTTESAVPAARIAFPDRTITAMATASGYTCRNRNGASGGKISEHARGNAVDIAAIVFSDGERLAMQPRTEDSDMEGAFQRSLTASACLFFTTVLSPGSDATHQDHLHLDVMKRKGGYRYCR